MKIIFRQLKKNSRPNAKFKRVLLVQLSGEYDRLYPGSWFSWNRVVAIPMATMLIFVTTGTGVYAYSSPEVTDGTKLYPVKQGIELIEKRLHFGPESEAQFRAKMMERRIQEGEVMIQKNCIKPEQAEFLMIQFKNFKEKNHLNEERKILISNKMDQLRVRVNESDLEPEYKRVILQKIELEPINN